MRSTLTALALAASLRSFAAAHGQHEHDHVADTKEPFIGWTQQDLDAKWGTDVCLPLLICKSYLNFNSSLPTTPH